MHRAFGKLADLFLIAVYLWYGVDIEVKNKTSYFETILITINDYLVNKYLNSQISYHSLNRNIIKLIKTPYFMRYYNSKPKNIIDIKIMVKNVTNYLNNIKLD